MIKKFIIFFILVSTVLAENPYRVLNSFNAGQLSELLVAREDLSKYHSGCTVMENMLPIPQGGAQKRPGTVYVAGSKSNTKIRLLPFEFSTEQSYIIELGNQYARFYTNNAQIMAEIISEDLAALNNIKGHWLLNDNLVTTAVLDVDGATHDGTIVGNTEDFHKFGLAGTGCFDFDGSDTVTIPDHGDFSFDDTADEDMSIIAVIYVTDTGNAQQIISKADTLKREWELVVLSDLTLRFRVTDESATKHAYVVTDDALSIGWNYVAATYESSHASWSAATAAIYMTLYINGAVVASSPVTQVGYLGMENSTADVLISGVKTGGNIVHRFPDKIDNVAVFSDGLSAA